MEIVVDIGNSRIKVGFFEGKRLLGTQICEQNELLPLLHTRASEAIIFSSVLPKGTDLNADLLAMGALQLSAELPGCPLKIAYDPPHTLGTDRIAAVAGAKVLHPKENCLVIDMGTCTTYTLVDEMGTVHGGAITPGLQMRLKALSARISCLPDIKMPQKAPELLGKSTKSALQAGAWHGAKAEITSLIDSYCETYKNTVVLLCGAHAKTLTFSTKIPTLVEESLVLTGLAHILQCHLRHNELSLQKRSK